MPFVEACVEQGANAEAAKYIRRLEEPAEKMQWFCNIGYVGVNGRSSFVHAQSTSVRPFGRFEVVMAPIAVRGCEWGMVSGWMGG